VVDSGQKSSGGKLIFRSSNLSLTKFRGLFSNCLEMGLGQKFLTRVGLGQVSLLWFGFELGKFPLKMSIFSLHVKSSSSGRVKKYPGQRWVGLLFNAGQK